jgi:hypothetical protein
MAKSDQEDAAVSPAHQVCPHCHLPAVLPEPCTPAVNAVIETQLARDADLFEAGRQHGIVHGGVIDPLRALITQWRQDTAGPFRGTASPLIAEAVQQCAAELEAALSVSHRRHFKSWLIAETRGLRQVSDTWEMIAARQREEIARLRAALAAFPAGASEPQQNLGDGFIDACGKQQAGIDAQVKELSMAEQIPTIGRIVHYRLSADDATEINRRRTNGSNIALRMKTFAKSAGDGPEVVYGWPEGAQAHIGNVATERDTFPMLITKVWGDDPSSAVNGQCFLDGNDVLWITSACVGSGPRTFSWPTRA